MSTPFLSLRESLSRSKAKLKEHLRIGSNDADRANDTTPTFTKPSKGSMAWSGVKTLLAVLESSSDAFGPLKSAIGGLNKCISIYEGASKGRKDYAELHDKLDGLLSDLAGHMARPMGLEMTNTVNRLCGEIGIELRRVEGKQAQNRIEQLANAMEASDEIYECYRRIHGHFERLTLNANMTILRDIDSLKMESMLTGMSPAMAAAYNSSASDEVHRGCCTPGTRQPQIELLLEWARDRETGRTCWMNGMAGTGKTTIAYTVCAKLAETFELGASFFCSRVIPECRQINRIIPSIAYQLARFSLPFRCALAQTLGVDRDIHTQALQIQYQKLIINPLRTVKESLPADLIVVIDALDECENEDSVGQVLDLLLSTEPTLPIRFLISSRPEREITQRMMGRVDEKGDRELVLHDLDSESVKSDVEVYMRQELRRIPLTETQWSGLIDRCGTLFIYAATTCRYVVHGYEMDTLDEAVNTILASASIPVEPGNKNAIDNLYLTILAAAFDKHEMTQVDRTRMKDLLETVICAVEPMTLDALVDILGLKSLKQVGALLRPLRSVLNVATGTELVAPLHASFPDFMLTPERSSKFHCEERTRHLTLTNTCLGMIQAVKPQFNICGLPSSHFLDDEIEDLEERIGQAISPSLTYACRYWAAHLSRSEYSDQLIDRVRDFFASRLLIWMEVLNLTQRMRHGTSIIREVERWSSKQGVPDDISKLAHDSWQFVSVYANHPVSRSTPHIYVSMLPFWPHSRPVSAAYMLKTARMIKPVGPALTERQLSLLATWNTSQQFVDSMSLSPDGTRLAAQTADTIEIIDTSTGDSILGLTPEHRVLSVAISPNGTQVIFCCNNSCVYLWDNRNGDKTTELLSTVVPEVQSGACTPDLSRVAFGSEDGDVYISSLKEGEPALGPLKGHTGAVRSVAFSPDGLHLASGSDDKTVRIWDTTTGNIVGNPLKGHAELVMSVSYSPDGSSLGSGSADRTTRVWDLQTGQTVLGPLEGHSHWVMSVAFSPNGCFIASGSNDQTILIYDAQTGQIILGPLQGHTHYVHSVIFSPDSARLFSCSWDGTIRTWNVQDMHVLDAPHNLPSLPSNIQCIRYSHSGSRIVSGSEDGTIHIWDVRTRQLVLGPLHAHTSYIWSVDFSPNDAYIASASLDGSLRIWDASNGKDLRGPTNGHGGWVRSVRFSPDSSVVAMGSEDGTVQIWDVMRGEVETTLLEENDDEENRDGMGPIGFSPDGSRLVCGSDKGILRVLDRHTGQTMVGPLQAHAGVVSSVEFSPDGSRILSASFDKSILIWDAQTGQRVLGPSEHSLKHDDIVNSASFSPDGRFIVSCSNDLSIRVWDAESGDLVFGPLVGHTDLVQSVQFSPDGSHVVSCSWDRTIRFWDVSSCRTKGKEDEGQDEGEATCPNQSTAKTYGLWTRDEDGWVVDQWKRRLVWVPSDLHSSLRGAYNDSIITDKPWLKLQFDGAKIGEEWTECYRP